MEFIVLLMESQGVGGWETGGGIRKEWLWKGIGETEKEGPGDEGTSKVGLIVEGPGGRESGSVSPKRADWFSSILHWM